MANYIQQATMGVFTPLVDKDKGDVSNRAKCAGAHLKNNVQTLAEDVVVIGGAAAGAKAISKNKKLTEKVTKFFDKIVDKLSPARKKNVTLIGESGKPFKTFELHQTKLAQKLKTMHPNGKIATLLMAPALAIASFCTAKNIYKSGQIDQKYTDKAKLEARQKEML